MHGLCIVLCSFGPERHGSVYPEGHGGAFASLDVLLESRRDLDDHLELTFLKALLDLRGRMNRRLLTEVSGSREILQIVTAPQFLIIVKRRELDVFDIRGYAETENNEKKRRDDE